MLTESLKSFCYVTPSAFDDLGNNGSGIVKPDFCRHSADMLKHGNQSFQKALHVFTVIKLQESPITEGKAENEIFCFMMKFSILVKIGKSEHCAVVPATAYGHLQDCTVWEVFPQNLKCGLHLP